MRNLIICGILYFYTANSGMKLIVESASECMIRAYQHKSECIENDHGVLTNIFKYDSTMGEYEDYRTGKITGKEEK